LLNRTTLSDILHQELKISLFFISNKPKRCSVDELIEGTKTFSPPSISIDTNYSRIFFWLILIIRE